MTQATLGGFIFSPSERMTRIEELLAIASNKSKTATNEYVTVHHDDLKCQYNSKFRWNKQQHRSVNGRNQHYNGQHKLEYLE